MRHVRDLLLNTEAGGGAWISVWDLREALIRDDKHAALCDPWKEPCSWCGKEPVGGDA